MKLMLTVLHVLWHMAHPHQSCGPEEEDVACDGGEISEASLCRQMLYDAFEEPERVAELAGLPAVSDEVAEMEVRAHHTRLTEMSPILGLLLGQAAFMGRTAAVLQCTEAEDDDPAHLEEITQVFTNIIKGSVIASVSSAVALGILEIRKEVISDE